MGTLTKWSFATLAGVLVVLGLAWSAASLVTVEDVPIRETERDTTFYLLSFEALNRQCGQAISQVQFLIRSAPDCTVDFDCDVVRTPRGMTARLGCNVAFPKAASAAILAALDEPMNCGVWPYMVCTHVPGGVEGGMVEAACVDNRCEVEPLPFRPDGQFSAPSPESE